MKNNIKILVVILFFILAATNICNQFEHLLTNLGHINLLYASTISQGVEGRVHLRAGDFMPSVMDCYGCGEDRLINSYVKRTLYIFEKTNITDVVISTSNYYNENINWQTFNKKLYNKSTTNSNGGTGSECK